MSRLWVLAAGVAPSALVFLACSGSSSHSGSPSAQGASSGSSGAGAAGGDVALAGGGAGPASGGANGAGHAGQATAGGGGPGAGESAVGGVGAIAGSSNVAGMSGAPGAQTDGGAGWVIPSTPGAGWTGPQDPACPSTAVSADAACASLPGTRCSYPESNSTYTLRCQCYTSSTGANRWWCQEHASIGYDLCPVAYTGNGSCPNIGDVTCYYVDSDDKLQACNCSAGTVKCLKWGL